MREANTQNGAEGEPQRGHLGSQDPPMGAEFGRRCLLVLLLHTQADPIDLLFG